MQVIIEFSDGVLSKRCASRAVGLPMGEAYRAAFSCLRQKSQRHSFSERQYRTRIPTVRACLVRPKSKKNWRNKTCKRGDVLRADRGASDWQHCRSEAGPRRKQSVFGNTTELTRFFPQRNAQRKKMMCTVCGGGPTARRLATGKWVVEGVSGCCSTRRMARRDVM